MNYEPITNYYQIGYIKIVLVIFALLIGIMIFPVKFPNLNQTPSSSSEFCRPDPPGQDVTIQATAMDEAWGTMLPGVQATYTRVKVNVPIDGKAIDPEHSLEGEVIDTAQGKFKIYYAAPVHGKTIEKWQGRVGESEQFYWVSGYMDRGISLARHGVVFALHLDEAGSPTIIDILGNQYFVMDIYKDENRPALPEEVYQCLDLDAPSPSDSTNLSVATQGVIVPPQAVASPNDQLQLEWFLLQKDKFIHHAWWYPVCKPAIYLYPPQKTLVNVKVNPQGYLTYVDPPYDMDRGWTVNAFPDGTLFSINHQPITNNYLYYESKVRDEAIKKPEKGWVVRFDELENLYKEILPKLGLNQTQSRDFIEYWNKALPQAPYYFVGIVDQKNVDQIERLEITPKPDYMNRVRVYFERLDSPKVVQAPVVFSTTYNLQPNTFSVIEWGGMVKNDPNHPFTCSQ